MTKSSPWKGVPPIFLSLGKPSISMGKLPIYRGLPIENCDFPWRPVSHNQMVKITMENTMFSPIFSMAKCAIFPAHQALRLRSSPGHHSLRQRLHPTAWHWDGARLANQAGNLWQSEQCSKPAWLLGQSYMDTLILTSLLVSMGLSFSLRMGWNIWLVVWNMNFIFPYIGNFIIPTD